MKRFFCIFLGSLLLTVCCSACGTQPQPAPQMEPQTTQMQAICELAKQNAVNVITALVQPIVAQADEEYQLSVA